MFPSLQNVPAAGEKRRGCTLQQEQNLRVVRLHFVMLFAVSRRLGSFFVFKGRVHFDL